MSQLDVSKFSSPEELSAAVDELVQMALAQALPVDSPEPGWPRGAGWSA